MKLILISSLVVTLAGCTNASTGLEPVRGSITYGGQPSGLSKAPVGSTVTNRFRDQFGQEWGERYIIQSDRSLKLVARDRIEYQED